MIVGDGPQRELLERGCSGKAFVRFVGQQTGSTLRQIYASAQAFAFASRVDTLGLVNMEAMASGLPVLVPSDSCIAELVEHGVSAYCYLPGVAGLAAGIGHLLDNTAAARRLSEAGRQVMIARWNETSFSRIWDSLIGRA